MGEDLDDGTGQPGTRRPGGWSQYRRLPHGPDAGGEGRPGAPPGQGPLSPVEAVRRRDHAQDQGVHSGAPLGPGGVHHEGSVLHLRHRVPYSPQVRSGPGLDGPPRILRPCAPAARRGPPQRGCGGGRNRPEHRGAGRERARRDRLRRDGSQSPGGRRRGEERCIPSPPGPRGSLHRICIRGRGPPHRAPVDRRGLL